MTKQEITTKAIEKAIAGGWKNVIIENHPGDYAAYYWQTTNYGLPVINELIYNHDFAKALWGSLHVIMESDDKSALWLAYANDGNPAWKFHLQQMVIAEDPIKYLGDNI